MRSDLIKKGVERAPHRSLLRATGVGEEDWDKPFVAICNSHIDIIPGHVHLDVVGNLVKDAVRAWKHGQAEVFVPLSHRPGDAQADFGEVTVVLNGTPTKVAFFVITLPYSDAIFCQVFPKECTETFQEGHR